MRTVVEEFRGCYSAGLGGAWSAGSSARNAEDVHTSRIYRRLVNSLREI